MDQSFIKHITVHTPNNRISNEDLGSEFDVAPDQIYKRTGVKNRFIVDDNEICSDLALKAGNKLFEEVDIKREDIDFLLYCTSGLDYVGPATACILHDQLGLKKNAGAIDVPMGCAGFTNGLIVASSLIISGVAKNILFIVADFPTTVLHKDDLHLRELFSDAAAAVLIGKEGKYEIGKLAFGTDGGGKDNLIIHGSGVREPLDAEWIEKYKESKGLLRGRMEMNGAEILKFSLREVPMLMEQTLESNNCSKEDIDLFIFHHASEIIIRFLTRKLGINPDKVFTCLEEYGNTVSASIPIALLEAEKQGRVKDNSTIFIAGFGIGYSWSATILKTD